jgi:hypothetical protein
LFSSRFLKAEGATMIRSCAKAFAAVASVFLLSASVRAGEWSVGIKGGLSVSDAIGVDVVEAEPMLGVTAGIAAAYSLNDMFSLQAEILYTMKGASGTHKAFFGGAKEADVRLSYLEFPVLAKMTFPVDWALRPNLFFGPAVAFEIASRAEFEVMGRTESQEIHQHVNDTDFGLVFGGGADIVTDRGSLILDVRYTLGMISADISTNALDLRNGVLSFLLGFSF